MRRFLATSPQLSRRVDLHTQKRPTNLLVRRSFSEKTSRPLLQTDGRRNQEIDVAAVEGREPIAEDFDGRAEELGLTRLRDGVVGADDQVEADTLARRNRAEHIGEAVRIGDMHQEQPPERCGNYVNDLCFFVFVQMTY